MFNNINCILGMVQLPIRSIDLVVTSPPYKDSDGYTEDLILKAARGIYDVLKIGSLCFVNFGHLAEDKFRPFRVCQLFQTTRLTLAETFVWEKTQFSPIRGKKRVNNLTEFIFMFYKEKMPNLDRLSIGVPYTDKSNIKRYGDGSDLRCAGNIWKFGYETIQNKSQKLHNDRFPLELPTRCIKLSGLKNGIVLDPFMGSGTTALAAKNLGLDYLGFEINPIHYQTSIERLK